MVAPNEEERAGAAEEGRRPASSVDPVRVRRLRLVGRLTQAFVRACRSWRLYTERHELRHRYVADLHRLIEDALADLPSLLLEVTPERLLWEGEVVHDESDDPRGLPFLLFRDGVRLVRFSRGVGAEEVEVLVSVLSGHLDATAPADEDIATRLWEARLPHVDVSVATTFVAVDEAERRVMDELEREVAAFLDALSRGGTAPEVPPLPAEADAPPPSVELEVEEADLPDGAAESPEESPAPYEAPETAPEDRLDVALARPSLGRLDLLRVRAQIEELAAGVASFDAVGSVLQQVAAAQTDPGELKAFLSDVRAAVLPFYGAGAFAEIVALLKPLVLWSRTAPDPLARQARLVRSLMASLAGHDALSLLVPSLGPDFPEAERGDLFAFVLIQHPEAESALFWLLGQAQSFAARRAISDALVVRSGFDPAPFKRRVAEESWRVVSDMVHCLARIGSAEAVQYMLAAFQRDDPTVREEVLTALRPFRGPRVDDLMRRALSDPAEKVRIAALRYLAFHRVRDAVQDVRERVTQRSFRARSATERRAFGIAWSHLARDEAVAHFAGELRRIAATAPEGAEEDALVAVSVLAAAGSPEARAALREAAPRLTGRARQACREALARS